jgi:hypothetical protein
MRAGSEGGRLSGTSPRSTGVRARRSRRPKTPTTYGPACRAAFAFPFLLELASMGWHWPVDYLLIVHAYTVSASRLCKLDTKNCPNSPKAPAWKSRRSSERQIDRTGHKARDA